MIETKNKPQDDRLGYFIVKDDRHEYLLKREGGKQTFLLRAENREQVYGLILRDLYAPVYEATPGQMIESTFGKPRHYRGSSKPTPQAKCIFPEPPKTELEQKRKNARRARTLGSSLSLFCQSHKCEKYKDGKTKGGVQKYRCPKCRMEEPHHQAGAPRKDRRKVALKGNPKCETCGQQMRVRGQWKGKRYYKCPICPSKPKERRDPGEELTAFVREHVTRMNSHDPQMRDDIVQELVTDILAGKIKRKEVEKRETIRRYAYSQERLRQNRHRDVSIDQSRYGDEDGLNLKNVLEG
ncbi:MAG: hypothetical protein QOE33_3050 [Acidobacteriota bacterium]|nr:hypothetical protein [Acidobacteriota bacterium]